MISRFSSFVGTTPITFPFRNLCNNSFGKFPMSETTSTSSSNRSLTLKPPPVDDQPFQQFCRDYSNYFSFPELMQQQFGQVVSTIETMLVRLDELSALIMTTSTTTRRMIETLFPTLREHSKFLLRVYAMIDKFEQLLEIMKKNTDELELRLRKAEDDFSIVPFGKFYRILDSVKSKSSESQNFDQPPQIVDTKEYFAKMKEELKKN
jgi:hypothetical protein